MGPFNGLKGLSPECFRFLNSSPHSPLKLVDFGLELKAHRWNAVEHLSGPDLQNPCPDLRVAKKSACEMQEKVINKERLRELPLLITLHCYTPRTPLSPQQSRAGGGREQGSR